MNGKWNCRRNDNNLCVLGLDFGFVTRGYSSKLIQFSFSGAVILSTILQKIAGLG